MSERFFILSEQGTHLVADPSVVPDPRHEEQCHFSLHIQEIPRGCQLFLSSLTLSGCEIGYSVHSAAYFGRQQFIYVVFLALSLGIDDVKGEVILVRAIGKYSYRFPRKVYWS